jgi:hypothetical protein
MSGVICFIWFNQINKINQINKTDWRERWDERGFEAFGTWNTDLEPSDFSLQPENRHALRFTNDVSCGTLGRLPAQTALHNSQCGLLQIQPLLNDTTNP